ncbi:MAG: DNA mismatch repair protein MutT, partial [Bacteroidaceae bacterium]|nr:DNA mismatch repair protein MutT [Bacteroidaceae bacterium]
SITYFALIDVAKYKRNNTQQSTAEWVDIDKLPPLVFDHNQMVDLSLQTVRSLVWKEPLIVNLMPKYFTLTQLQHAYETVIGKRLDKRNYRRTIIDQGFLVKTDKIDKKTSKRGAAIYQMNPEINC